MIRRALAPLLLLAVPLALAACDANDDEQAAARFRILLTDAPLDDADSANVTVERVELLAEDDRVVLLSDSVYDFNLLDLRDGVTAEVADSLVFGEDVYTQLRVIVGEEARLVMNDGTVYDLRVPSGTQTGIKINLPEIDVDEAGEDVSVTVDFNLERSFVTLGPEDDPHGFLFKPVLQIAAVTINGDDVPEDDLPPTDPDGL